MNGLSMEGKRLALSALDITIMATLNNIRIKGAIPMERSQEYQEKFTTIGQTSGCLATHAYDWGIPFHAYVRMKLIV